MTSEPLTRPRILLVEDEENIAAPLAEGLEREGFDVTAVHTGAAGLEAATSADVVLLDLGLPDVDGIDVCRRLRQTSQVPIIVLTARAAELDRVLLLELGADDYMVKPFGHRELVARIRAVRRRAQSPPAAGGTDVATGPAGHQVGAISIDHRARRVFVAGAEVALTPKEFDLLARLAEEPGRVIRREELIEQVWDEHWWGSTKTLDVHIASLRKKLGNPAFIGTVRGVGYRLDERA